MAHAPVIALRSGAIDDPVHEDNGVLFRASLSISGLDAAVLFFQGNQPAAMSVQPLARYHLFDKARDVRRHTVTVHFSVVPNVAPESQLLRLRKGLPDLLRSRP